MLEIWRSWSGHYGWVFSGAATSVWGWERQQEEKDLKDSCSAFRGHSLLRGAYFSSKKWREYCANNYFALWFPNCVFLNRKTSWEWANWGPTQFISVIPSPSSSRPWLSQIHNHMALEIWPENPSWNCLATYFLLAVHRQVDIPL